MRLVKRLGGVGVALLVLNEIRGAAMVAGLLSAWSAGGVAAPRDPYEAARLLTCLAAGADCFVRTAEAAAPGARRG